MILIIILAIVGFITITAATAVAAPLTTTISTFTSSFTQYQDFVAELTSEMVVPPVKSNATGVVYFQLDKKDNNLIVRDLDDAKAAHIHIGKEGEKNDTVIVTLYKPFKAPRLLGGILSVDDDITSDILEGPLAGKQLSDLVNFMNNRTAYVDIHSYEYPNGELRGQISNILPIGS